MSSLYVLLLYISIIIICIVVIVVVLSKKRDKIIATGTVIGNDKYLRVRDSQRCYLLIFANVAMS
jgi:hypothetical protein